MTVGERPLVILRFDVFLFDAWNFSQLSHLDFVVEVTDIAHDSHILHLAHVFGSNDVAVASGRNIYVTIFQSVFNRKHLVTFHRRLQSTNWVDFCNNHTCTLSAERLCATFTNVAIAADNGNLASQHHVGGTHNAVGERVAATIQVVEFRFCNRVVHVDGWERKNALFCHLV